MGACTFVTNAINQTRHQNNYSLRGEFIMAKAKTQSSNYTHDELIGMVKKSRQQAAAVRMQQDAMSKQLKFWRIVGTVGFAVFVCTLVVLAKLPGELNRANAASPTATTVVAGTSAASTAPATFPPATTTTEPKSAPTAPPTTAAKVNVVAPPAPAPVVVRGITLNNCPNPSQAGINKMNNYMGPVGEAGIRAEVCK